MRIPYIAAVATLALVACQKNADTGSNVAITNDTSMTTTNTSESSDMGNVAGAAIADKAFLTEAIKGDNAEVALGKLAATQASSDKAKELGTMLVTDHGAHKDKVASLLKAAGGTATDSSAPDAIATQNLLRGKSGAAFDAAFKKAAIADHQKDIAKYEKQAAGNDPATAQLAKDTLPTLKKHLAAAQAL